MADVIRRMKDLRKQRVLDILLIDNEDRLVGLLPLQTVVLAPPATTLSELVTTAPPSVNSMAPRDEVVEVLTNTGATTLPVVSVDGVVQGVIRYESLVQAARDDAMTDLQTMVGVSRDERALSLEPPVVAAERPVTAQRAMARDDERNGIAPIGGPDGAGCRRRTARNANPRPPADLRRLRAARERPRRHRRLLW